MEKNEFLLVFDEIIEAEPGTIKETDILADVDGWDSMAMLGFIAMLDEKYGLIVPPEKIADAIVVSDLMALLDGNIKETIIETDPN